MAGRAQASRNRSRLQTMQDTIQKMLSEDDVEDNDKAPGMGAGGYDARRIDNPSNGKGRKHSKAEDEEEEEGGEDEGSEKRASKKKKPFPGAAAPFSADDKKGRDDDEDDDSDEDDDGDSEDDDDDDDEDEDDGDRKKKNAKRRASSEDDDDDDEDKEDDDDEDDKKSRRGIKGRAYELAQGYGYRVKKASKEGHATAAVMVCPACDKKVVATMRKSMPSASGNDEALSSYGGGQQASCPHCSTNLVTDLGHGGSFTSADLKGHSTGAPIDCPNCTKTHALTLKLKSLLPPSNYPGVPAPS